MQYIQFPWRFMNFIGLFISIIAAYSIFKIRKYLGKKGSVFVVVIIILTLFTNLKLFNPQNYNAFSDSYYTSQDHIRFDTSKISDEYLPSDFQKPLTESDIPREKFVVKSGEGIVKLNINRVDELKGVYAFSDDGIIHVNTAYFPAWKAYINKTEVEVNNARDGMDIFVEKGSGEITLKFIQTPVEIIGNAITVIVFLALLAVIIFFKSYAKKTT